MYEHVREGTRGGGIASALSATKVAITPSGGNLKRGNYQCTDPAPTSMAGFFVYYIYTNHGRVYGGQPVPWRAGTPLADSHSHVQSPSQFWQCSLQCQDCDGLRAREPLLAVPMAAAERAVPNSGSMKLTMVSLFVSASFVNQHLPGVAERGW